MKIILKAPSDLGRTVIRNAKLDLAALRASSVAARDRINQLPPWQQEIIKIVSVAASSEQTMKVLADYERHQNK